MSEGSAGIRPTRLGPTIRLSSYLQSNDLSGEKFQLEEGFEFEGEGKLLGHQIAVQKDQFLIELSWRLEPTQSCKRVVRVVNRNDDTREKIWHLPPNHELSRDADDNGLVHEKIAIPFSMIPAELDPDEVYFELYFSGDNHDRPGLLNHENRSNMLLFSLKETRSQYQTG